MRTSNEGRAEIAGHEGIVLSPYKDSVGVWTWGLGHTKGAGAPDPAKMAKGKASTIPEVMAQFAKDITKYEADVDRAVKVPLKQHEFDALVSFHYNTGGIFKATLTKLLNRGDRAGAAKAFMNWIKPKEITGRRKAEMSLFKTGKYGTGMATVYPANANGTVQWSKGKRVNVRNLLTEPTPAPVPVPTPVSEPQPPPKHIDVAGPAGGGAVGTAAGAVVQAAGFDWWLAILVGVIVFIVALVIIKAVRS